MFLVDSHCHVDLLDLEKYEGKLSNVLHFAKENFVKHLLCVCITLDNFAAMLAAINNYDFISASVGLHPNEKVAQEPSILELITLAENNVKVIAIGETGLDYYRQKGEHEGQQQRFRNHIKAALAVKKPLIIHCRQAKEDMLTILKEEGAEQIGGVLHCFTEDLAMAFKAMDLNFYISFSGIITFKNALALQEVAKKIPLNRMLIETDAPYLAPVPYRGKNNEPAYVYHVAKFIADLRGESINTIANETTNNFFTLFPHAKRSEHV